MTEEAFHRLALLAGLRPGRTVLALRDVLLKLEARDCNDEARKALGYREAM